MGIINKNISYFATWRYGRGETWTRNENMLLICAIIGILVAVIFLYFFIRYCAKNKKSAIFNLIASSYCFFLSVLTLLFLKEVINNENIFFIVLLSLPLPLTFLIMFIRNIIKKPKDPVYTWFLFVLFWWSLLFSFFSLNWCIGFIG